MRISEPLKATRGDLLLPSDSGIDREVMFLRVGAPKPGRRGRGKVQHTRITDRMTVQLAVRFFSHISLLTNCCTLLPRRRIGEGGIGF